jgi:hypothetical protein
VGNGGAFDLCNASSESVGELHASGGNPKQYERVGAFVALEHFVGNAGQRTLDVVGVEYLAVLVAGVRPGHADLLPRLTGRT